MSYQYFTQEQFNPFIVSSLLLISSVLFYKSRRNLSVALLFLASVAIGFFIANLDHFLILWDEQYHALVAKNLSRNPLKPVLIADPVLGYDYRNWTSNHIWLHKQPLFLWQMALSIKIFGNTELAVRIPSILMHAAVPLFIYRIGKITGNRDSGYYGGLLFAVAYFPLELVAGRYATDHNDVAFIFYVFASFWAWFEYESSGKKYWLLLIGFFSGCAVLVKWLMGLLIFVIWLITKTIMYPKEWLKIRSYLPMIYAGAVSLFLFLPWQIYISQAYPVESAYEYQHFASNFLKPVEGHHESTWYYFTDGLNMAYGSGVLVPLILLLGVAVMLLKISRKPYKIAIITSIVFVYLFYTLAATKMTAFPLIVAPFIFLGTGYLISEVIFLIQKKVKIRFVVQILTILIPMVSAFAVLNLNKIQHYHTDWKPHDNLNRKQEQSEMDFIQSLPEILNDESYVIFNASITPNGHIPVMFYTNYVAYDFIPSEQQIREVRSKSRKIAIVDTGNLPDYIPNDPEIKRLKIADEK
jgi:4-amino-4-deoxy-L-arabinose transferase-like glycosyltransferase